MNLLNTIQTGDQIIFNLFGTRSIETVERTTKTQITVKGQRFRRANGNQIASDADYDGRCISAATENAIAWLRVEEARRASK